MLDSSPSRKEGLSVEELGHVLLPRCGGLLAMLTAYFDESETQNDAPRHFIMSGYVSDVNGWRAFERSWWHALVCDGFQAHGIHWTDLAGGWDRFKALSGHENAKLREKLQRKYIAIIKASYMQGLYAAFDVADFERIGPTIRKLRAPKMMSPYYHAFESAIGRMCTLLRDGGMLDADAKIAFVFDQKKEVEGRAKVLYDAIVANDNVWFAKHLGPITFASSKDLLPLQASDALANEVKRDLGRGIQERRWQFEALLANNQVADYVFSGELFDQFAARLEAKIQAFEQQGVQP